MKEQEMRQIVRSLLGQATRKVVLPASLGLGLALSGCADRAAVSMDGGVDDGRVEQPSTALYATPFPAPDRDVGHPDYDALSPPPDASTVGQDAEPDHTMLGKYGAPFPDLGTQEDSFQTINPLYAAPMPDGGLVEVEKDALPG